MSRKIVKGYITLDCQMRDRHGYTYDFDKLNVYDGEIGAGIKRRGMFATTHYGSGMGIAFFQRIPDCFMLDDRGANVYEVRAVGDIVRDHEKFSTNAIELVRIVPDDEVDEARKNQGENNKGFGKNNKGFGNKGNSNKGLCNRGDNNEGNLNFGNYNEGSCNEGSNNKGGHNIGNWNTGDRNRGDKNNGYLNYGDYNNGNFNIGDYNHGDSNYGSFNVGDLNTGSKNIGSLNLGSNNLGSCNLASNVHGHFNTEGDCACPMMFNKPVKPDKFENILIPDFIKKPHFNETYEFDCDKPLTETQKREKYVKMWKEMLWLAKGSHICWNYDYEWLQELPNFSFDIFEQITGLTKSELEAESDSHRFGL